MELERNTAFQYKQKVIVKKDSVDFDEHNWKKLHSDFVYKNLRAEKLEHDFHADDVIDLILMRRNEGKEAPPDRIKQPVSEPFMVHSMASRVVKTIFKHLFPSKRLITSHLDATGKLVRSNAHFGDTIYTAPLSISN